MPSGYYKVVSVRWHDPTPPKQIKRQEQRKREQNSRRREVEIAEQSQRLTERRERWRLEKWERWVELGMKAMSFLCALAATVFGSWSGEPTVLGGSGAAGLVGLFWMLQRSSPARSGGSERASSSLPTEG